MYTSVLMVKFLGNSYNDTFYQFNASLLIKSNNSLKVPLLWVMKCSYFGFGSPQQQVDIHARSKNTFIFL